MLWTVRLICPMRGCRSRRGPKELRQSDEIVGDGGQREDPANLVSPSMAGFAQPADGLHPAEGFLDPLTGTLADAVARVPRCPSVDGRASVRGILGDVRNNALLAQGRNKSGRVVGSVGS